MIERRNIEGMEGMAIGSDGTVWTCRNHNGLLTDKWHELNRYKRPYGAGYWVVCLRPQPNSKVVQRYIHRLVLEAFVGPQPEGMEGCHNDGNTDNNDVSNLRWDTRLNNHDDKRKHGTLPRGESHSGAKLTEDQVRRIRELIKTGVFQRVVAEEFGISQGTVGCIARRKRWKHVK
jgi:hypothetical protein